MPPSPHAGATRGTDALEVRLFQPTDEAALLTCLAESFAAHPSVDRWRRLHLGNPDGPSLIVLARDGQGVAACVSLMRRTLIVDGIRRLTAHSLDGGTRPEWRRRGLRRTLAQRALMEAAARGFVLTTSVANDQSMRSNRRYEGRAAVRSFPPVLIRPLRPFAAVTRLLGLGRQATVGPEPSDCAACGPLPVPDADRARLLHARPGWRAPAFDARHDAVWGARADDGRVHFDRNARWLAWRYDDLPEAGYVQRDVVRDGRLVATAVARLGVLRAVRLLFLMDWQWHVGHEADARRLLADVVDLGRALHADGVSTMAMPASRRRRLLARAGFLPVPRILQRPRATLMIGPCGAGEGWRTGLLDSRSWECALGDGFIL